MLPEAPLITSPCPRDVFAELEERAVRHAVWKDLAEIDDFWRGDVELDLLVHPADREAFRRIATRNGFAEYRNHVDIYGGELTHFIHFAGEFHYHLHVHYSLLTGDHTVKEYCLDELVADDLLFAGPRRNGIRTVGPVAELAIGIVRLIVKAGSSAGVKPSELARLRSLSTQDLFADAIAAITARVELSTAAVARLRAILQGEDAPLGELARELKRFSPLRRLGPLQARIAKAKLRIADGVARRTGLSNKVLTVRAPTLAIIGVDGSGKSAVAEALRQILGKKVSVKRFYLGGNTSTYTPLTWMAYVVHRASCGVSRPWPNSVLLSDLRTILLAHLELCKCRDRVRRIRAGLCWARRGVLVVFERYPIQHLFDYPRLVRELDGGEIAIRPFAERIVRSRLAAIDALLDDVGPADSTALIHAGYDQIAARRRLRPEERVDVKAKLEIWREFRERQLPADISVIENEGPVGNTIARALELLSLRLCSLSS